MPPKNPEHTHWFVEHVLPHETVLRLWLHGRFGGQIEVDDVIQEAYSRLLSAHQQGTVVSPKAFVDHAARNIALNQIRHRGYTHPVAVAETDVAGIVDTNAGVSEVVSRAEDIQLLICAIQALPERCRQIFTLRKIYGLSQKEIATKLGISEHTVEVQGSIGVQKCAAYFQQHGDTV